MPTIAQRIEELLELEGLLAGLEARKAKLREELKAIALERMTEDGAAPSWKAKGLGQVLLVAPDPAPAVADDLELAAWVSETAPTEVIPTVRKAFLDALKATATLDGDKVVDGSTGEIIPGMRVHHRAPYLTVRLDADAKRAAIEVAAEAVGDGVLAGPEGTA